MMYELEIKAAKKCFTQLTNQLTQEDVDIVLNLFEDEDQIAQAFDVHRTTVSTWVLGKNKPNGRNKLAFNFLINYLKS